MAVELQAQLVELLKSDGRFIDEQCELIRSAVVDHAWRTDRSLVALLLANDAVKAAFFEEIDGHWVFKAAEFVEYVSDKHFLADNYTKFRNRIGLTIGGKFLRERGEVSLAWPYKDCVLEGNQDGELIDSIDYDTGGISKTVNWQGGGDFVFCELRKHNEQWMERIQAADSAKEMLAVFDALMQWSFLKWYVDPLNPQTARDIFIAIGEGDDGIGKQKSLLCQLLDKNNLYVNASEMADTDVAVPDEDKRLTREFLDF